MAKRRPRPTKVIYTREVFYGAGRPPPRKKLWPYLGAGILVLAVLPKEPLLALAILSLGYYLWRKHHGR